MAFLSHGRRPVRLDPRAARRIALALLGLGCALSGCREEPPRAGGDGAPDAGTILFDASAPDGASQLDAGVDGGAARSAIVVTVHALNLGPLVSSATLEVERLAAENDRGPALAATLSLEEPIDLRATERWLLEDAIPATYGALRFVGLGAIRLEVAGAPLTIDLGGSMDVTLRCRGGAYLPFGGAIAMDVDVDFAPVLSALAASAVFPPAGETTVDDEAAVAAIADALRDAGSIDCAPLP
jgi:hypothetical protein